MRPAFDHWSAPTRSGKSCLKRTTCIPVYRMEWFTTSFSITPRVRANSIMSLDLIRSELIRLGLRFKVVLQWKQQRRSEWQQGAGSKLRAGLSSNPVVELKLKYRSGPRS
ncbi:hypothetical protein EVAR_96883_1 [Eumeta japonica]|uniref:Uncharacterized protein n=1 Tax=Eumeta variegata TaxID=151549 RepID=A0A4C1SX96_EUMVA|nr:hypothetical protein EVAR_96883_1 [Eumeta japonica]